MNCFLTPLPQEATTFVLACPQPLGCAHNPLLHGDRFELNAPYTEITAVLPQHKRAKASQRAQTPKRKNGDFAAAPLLGLMLVLLAFACVQVFVLFVVFSDFATFRTQFQQVGLQYVILQKFSERKCAAKMKT